MSDVSLRQIERELAVGWSDAEISEFLRRTGERIRQAHAQRVRDRRRNARARLLRWLRRSIAPWRSPRSRGTLSDRGGKR